MYENRETEWLNRKQRPKGTVNDSKKVERIQM